MTNEHAARTDDAVSELDAQHPVDPPSEPTDPLMVIPDAGDGPTDPSDEVEATLEGATPSSEHGPADVVAQIERTDDRLRAWRSESVRRREAWDAEQEAIEARAQAERQRAVRFAAAGGVFGALLGLVALAVVFAVRSPEPEVAAAHVAPTPVAEEVIATVVPVEEPAVVVEEPVVEEPAQVEAAAEPVAEPVAEPQADPEPEVAEVVALEPEPRALPVTREVAGSVPSQARVWSDRSYVWVSFVHPNPWGLTLRWLDAQGRVVLEPMGCARTECRAGRSHTRIDNALAEGAAPGTWTVEACADGACSELGRFEVPASR